MGRKRCAAKREREHNRLREKFGDKAIIRKPVPHSTSSRIAAPRDASPKINDSTIYFTPSSPISAPVEHTSLSIRNFTPSSPMQLPWDDTSSRKQQTHYPTIDFTSSSQTYAMKCQKLDEAYKIPALEQSTLENLGAPPNASNASEEDLYNASPRAARRTSSNANYASEEDLYNTTPRAVRKE